LKCAIVLTLSGKVCAKVMSCHCGDLALAGLNVAQALTGAWLVRWCDVWAPWCLDWCTETVLVLVGVAYLRAVFFVSR
jgi:hypothetical protein